MLREEAPELRVRECGDGGINRFVGGGKLYDPKKGEPKAHIVPVNTRTTLALITSAPPVVNLEFTREAEIEAREPEIEEVETEERVSSG